MLRYYLMYTYVTALPKPGQNFALFSTLTGHEQVEPQIAKIRKKISGDTAWKKQKFTLFEEILREINFLVFYIHEIFVKMV